MKTLSFFQCLSVCFKSMSFREAVLQVWLLVMVLMVLILMELVTRILILAAGLFAMFKAVT